MRPAPRRWRSWRTRSGCGEAVLAGRDPVAEIDPGSHVFGYDLTRQGREDRADAGRDLPAQGDGVQGQG